MAMVVYWPVQVGARTYLNGRGDLLHPLGAGVGGEHLAAGDEAIDERQHAAGKNGQIGPRTSVAFPSVAVARRNPGRARPRVWPALMPEPWPRRNVAGVRAGGGGLPPAPVPPLELLSPPNGSGTGWHRWAAELDTDRHAVAAAKDMRLSVLPPRTRASSWMAQNGGGVEKNRTKTLRMATGVPPPRSSSASWPRRAGSGRGRRPRGRGRRSGSW